MTNPAFFLSHGAPTMILDHSATHHFIAQLGSTLSRPDAIIITSGHWETDIPAITAGDFPKTIHDFYGFPRPLYDIEYPAPGGGRWLNEISALFADAGVPLSAERERGFDHGAWAPLKLMFPDADIPTVQLSLLSGQGAAAHFALGRLLRPLRDRNVLLIGSGSLTHNLHSAQWRNPQAAEPAWVSDFADWTERAVTGGQTDELLAYRKNAPFAAENHPTDEHLMPFFFALGAGSDDVPGRRLHTACELATIRLDAYAFD